MKFHFSLSPKDFQSFIEKSATPKRRLSVRLKPRVSNCETHEKLRKGSTAYETNIEQIEQFTEEQRTQERQEFSNIILQEEEKFESLSQSSTLISALTSTEITDINFESLLVNTECLETESSTQPNSRASPKPYELFSRTSLEELFKRKDEKYNHYLRDLQHAENLRRFKETFPASSLMKRSKSLEGKGNAHRRRQRRPSLRQFSLEDYVKYLEIHKMLYMPSSHQERVDRILASIHKKIDKRDLLEFLWLNEEVELKKETTSFGQSWESTIQQITASSPFRNFSSYKIRPYIVKGGDDLRQELIAMQLIHQFQGIWEDAGLSLRLRPYDIIVISEDAGIIGTIFSN